MIKSIIKSTSIMFTDVVGYSRMVGVDEKHAIDLLEEHNLIISQSIEKYDGHIIKMIGDSVFAEFENAINCANSAIAIQIALKERNNLKRKEDRIQIRIGLHCGNVIVKGDDIFGNDVNLGSRIEGIAPPGGIAGSYMFCKTIDSEQAVYFREMGHVKLKNIIKPQCLYKIYLNKYDYEQETNSELRRFQEERGINFINIDTFEEVQTVSVALFYLKNLGSNSDEYFCYEFSESLTETLKKINNFRVPSFSDTLKYKNSDLPKTEIARQLIVDNIIEGHILKSNEKLIVSIKIIDTNSGEILIDNDWKGSINSIKRLQFQILRDILKVFDISAPEYLQKYFTESISKDSEAYNYYAQAKYLYDTISQANDLSRVKELFKKAITLDNEYVDAHAQLAMTYHRLGQNEKAEQILEDALSIAETNNDEYGLSIVLNCLGAIYMDWTKYEKAFNHYKKALIIQVELEDRFLEAKILNNLGGCYKFLGNNDKSLECLKDSIQIKNNMEEYKSLGFSYAEMGNVYYEIGNYSLAIDNYKYSLGKFRASNMRYNEGRVASLIAEMYLEVGYYNDMKRYLQETKEIISEFDIPFTSGKLHLISARYSFEMKDFDNAINNYKESMNYFQIAEQRYFSYRTMIELGLVYFSINKKKEAYNTILQAEKISRKLSLNEDVLVIEILIILFKEENIDDDEKDLIHIYEKLFNSKARNIHKTWWYLGLVYQSFKDSDKTQECFKQAQHFLNKNAKRIENIEHRKSFINNIGINKVISST